MMPRFAALCLGMSLWVLLPGSVRTDDSTRAEGVPAVKGLPAAKARAVLQAAGFVAKFILGESAPSSDKELSVYEQNPPAGEIVAPGRTVQLKLYAKRSPSAVVPGVIGKSPKEAKAALLTAGLVPKFRIGSVAPLGEGRKVYAEIPAPGSAVAPGSTVELTIHSLSDTGLIPVLRRAGPELAGVVASSGFGRGVESIDARSGDLSLTAMDLVVPAGPIRLEVARSLQPFPAGFRGMLGSRWRLNWERCLLRVGKTALILELTQARIFELDESAPPSGSTERFRSADDHLLTFTGGGAICTAPDGTKESFDNLGRLIERRQHNGNTITLRYDETGHISRIDGPYHSSLKFSTDSAGCLMRVEGSNGTAVHYFYRDQPGLAPADAGQLVSYSFDKAGHLRRINDPRGDETLLSYDEKGRVTKRQSSDETEEQFEYDDATNTRRFIDAAGNVTTTRASSDGRRIEITDPLGGRSVVELSSSGQPLVVAGPTKVEARLTYDLLGRILTTQSPAGLTRFEYLENTQLPTVLRAPDGNLSFTYDSQHNLLRVTSDKDKTLNSSFEYEPNGQVKKTTSGNGQTRSFTYDDAGRRASVTDTAGNKWRFEYDRRGNLLATINPLGGITARSYDAEDRLTRVTDEAGSTTRLEYAQRGRNFEVSVIDPRGGVSRSVYDPHGRLMSASGPGDRMVRYNYDAAGHLTSLTDAGRTYRFEYDAGGNLLRDIDPRGGVTSRIYDPLGRPTSITDPAGAVSQFEFSRAGLLTRSIDPTGNPLQYRHDKQGRLLAVIDEAERTAACEYAPSGRLARIVPPSGPALDLTYDEQGHLETVRRGQQVLVTYEYDVLGRRTQEKAATGLVVNYHYDALGKLASWTDNLGAGGTYEYDGVGRMVATTNASGATSRAKYDAAGNVLETTDALGHTQYHAYDDANRLSEVAGPTGEKARFEYTSDSQIAVVHHPSGGQSTFDYDSLGLPTRAADPAGGESTAIYDSAGRLTSATDAKKQTTLFRYDTAGRLSEKRLADGKVVRYRYDNHGRLSAVDDGAFPVRYTDDLDGRLTRIEYPAIKRSLSYEYDPSGRTTKFIDSEGRAIGYEYDAFDRLSAMKYGEQSITFAYDAKNRLTSLAYPNGVKGTWEYNLDGRPVKLAYIDSAGKTIAGWTYVYDAAGNCSRAVGLQGQTTSYRYDPSGQLAEEEAGDSKPVKYTYGPGGNRITREQNGDAVRYTYDQADRLISGTETYAYDANGNLVDRKGPKGTTRYVYDAVNRLVKVVLPGGAEVSYGYAPTGERVWRRDARGLTYYVTDGVNLLAELGEDLKPRASYVHGPGVDRPLVMVRDGQDFCFHADRLGTICRLTDRQGAIAASYEYDPFGEIRSKQGALENPFCFTARERDAATGLYYYRARYYDASLGRFLSKDALPGQLADAVTLNPYPYARNNPARFVDFTGMGATDVLTLGPNGSIGRGSQRVAGMSPSQAGGLETGILGPAPAAAPNAPPVRAPQEKVPTVVPGSSLAQLAQVHGPPPRRNLPPRGYPGNSIPPGELGRGSDGVYSRPPIKGEGMTPHQIAQNFISDLLQSDRGGISPSEALPLLAASLQQAHSDLGGWQHTLAHGGNAFGQEWLRRSIAIEQARIAMLRNTIANTEALLGLSGPARPRPNPDLPGPETVRTPGLPGPETVPTPGQPGVETVETPAPLGSEAGIGPEGGPSARFGWSEFGRGMGHATVGAQVAAAAIEGRSGPAIVRETGTALVSGTVQSAVGYTIAFVVVTPFMTPAAGHAAGTATVTYLGASGLVSQANRLGTALRTRIELVFVNGARIAHGQPPIGMPAPPDDGNAGTAPGNEPPPGNAPPPANAPTPTPTAATSDNSSNVPAAPSANPTNSNPPGNTGPATSDGAPTPPPANTPPPTPTAATSDNSNNVPAAPPANPTNSNAPGNTGPGTSDGASTPPPANAPTPTPTAPTTAPPAQSPGSPDGNPFNRGKDAVGNVKGGPPKSSVHSGSNPGKDAVKLAKGGITEHGATASQSTGTPAKHPGALTSSGMAHMSEKEKQQAGMGIGGRRAQPPRTGSSTPNGDSATPSKPRVPADRIARDGGKPLLDASSPSRTPSSATPSNHGGSIVSSPPGIVTTSMALTPPAPVEIVDVDSPQHPPHIRAVLHRPRPLSPLWTAVRILIETERKKKHGGDAKSKMGGHQVPSPDDPPDDEFFHRRAEQIVAEQEKDTNYHPQAQSIDQQLTEIHRQRQAEIDDYNRRVTAYNQRVLQSRQSGGGHGSSVNYGQVIQGIGNLFGGGGGGGGHHN